jgi:choline dehydrogenase-like flavoprotein
MAGAVTSCLTRLQKPRIVVVGAGFAGLHAAKGLAAAPFDVTVIDRHNYHLFLYQVPTAGLSPADIASPIRSILREQKNTKSRSRQRPGARISCQAAGAISGENVDSAQARARSPRVSLLRPRHDGDYPSQACRGRNRIAQRDFVAWLLWCVAHMYFLIGFRNRLSVAMNWMWSYATFQRGTRLTSIHLCR